MKIVRTDFEIDGVKTTRLMAWACDELRIDENKLEHSKIATLINPQILGFVDLRHDARKCAEFRVLFVVREHRMKHIGTALLETAESIARDSGCKTIACNVQCNNEDAIDFYEALGYKFAWEYPDDKDRIMVKEL